ncbi:MAG TPA: sigma-54 dependent transcriptional regulator [Gemmatimonadaceae bacterium]|nr:sigma-54 dependent transcriptional regulator [Gemmatimonadaceae bacterium]
MTTRLPLNTDAASPDPIDAAATPDPRVLQAGQRSGVRVLVIDDDRSIREGCTGALEAEGYSVEAHGRSDDLLGLVRRARFDIALVDLYMTPVPGMEILRSILAVRPDAIVVMMTGNPSVNSSVEALRGGAWDYLPKPFSASHLQILVGRAAFSLQHDRETARERAAMREDGAGPGEMSLLGASPEFRKVVDLARRVARTNASVMLIGESGTGKELIAQFIHKNSARARNPLVPLNCAAVPEHLLESEMFGHRKGSFTGADRDKVGLIEVAHGSTFFLDELTEMPLTLQAKLLRVVQDGVLRRVGSEKPDATVDVRFLSATNRDPRAAIASKHLREDLFYRLNVFPINLPPLRERAEDIRVLAEHFLARSWVRHHSLREDPPRFSESALERLQACPWRGNVRELQNVVEQLAVLATPGASISPDEITLHDSPNEPQARASMPTALLDDAYHVAKERVLANFEKEYLTRLVSRAGGNMSRAARLASVDRTTLYRLLERHSVRRDSAEPPPE